MNEKVPEEFQFSFQLSVLISDTIELLQKLLFVELYDIWGCDLPLTLQRETKAAQIGAYITIRHGRA